MKKRFLILLLFTVMSYAELPLSTLQPYLLPENHPATEILDQIFSKQKPLAGRKAFKEAGFCFLERSPRKLLSAKHPLLPGYIIKTYLNTQRQVRQEWLQWIQRIEGANLIRRTIAKYHYEKWCKAPRKWIYIIPYTPGTSGRKTLLICEDMEIVTPDKNWKSYYYKMTLDHLEALVTLLSENGLFDSTYIDNIPFSRDGRIAFIDTEHYNGRLSEQQWRRLEERLNPKMAHELKEMQP